jgi:ribosomal protein L11 methyltransferase
LDYIEVKFYLFKYDPILDLLKQGLCEVGYESFIDDTDSISAFISQINFSKELFDNKASQYSRFIKSIEIKKHPYQNWNETWESNFNPIHINEHCVIRGSFHEAFDLNYEIIIDPEMSFGTGHHQTTRLIAKDLFSQKISGKKVLDFGCGTGILSILADKLNAQEVDAIEIDPIAVNNAKENAKKNNSNKINFILGDGFQIPIVAYDLILININKNTIMDQFKYLKKGMKKNTVVLFSGFFKSDIDSIENLGVLNGLITLYSSLENNWALLVMKYK